MRNPSIIAAALAFAALLTSFPASAALECRANEGYMKAQILAEPGCPAGLVILNVETICVEGASPALKSLRAGKSFELCMESVLDPSGKTWLARVYSARESN